MKLADPSSPDLSLIRSVLFTPADKPERFAKAAASGADGVILDIEDGVGLASKQEARQTAINLISKTSGNILWALRIQSLTTSAGIAGSARPPRGRE